MNAIVDFEAAKLTTLFSHGDILGIHMFMDQMNIPLDVQDKLYAEISALKHLDPHNVSLAIEHHGQSQLSERLSY
ncbi:hypothetical protein N7V09_15630 [Shewanella seohaensis]|uniref:hypothetical protein n=1 Tax=Shewanella seohaensis TaxID=755175 RepID=UPI00200E9778|nr:hypothetical protein [Shewanella seohaensis]MCL1122414.1 hypothetical protein [Shewanella seohaensis]UXM81226.1 hypothetical protein N7V09_15630 [Shewanella seohaensis]